MSEVKKLDAGELLIPSHALQIQEPIYDIRDLLGPFILLTLLSPLCFYWLSGSTALLGITAYYGLPSLVRLRYPTFMRPNILDDLRINGGASLSLLASFTALLLQVSPWLII